MSTITVIEKPVNEGLVRLLETCLLRAKSGQIQGAVIIQLWEDGRTNHIRTNVYGCESRFIGELFIAANMLSAEIGEKDA